TCRLSRCSRLPSARAPTPTTPPTPNTHTATGSARSRCYSRSTSSTSRRCSFWRGSCTAPMSPTIATRPRSRAACSRSPNASTCSTAATTASSSCPCRSTTHSTPGVKTGSQAPAKATEVSLARVGFIAIPPGAKPGFDHADVHRQRRRIYVAHTGADRIEVLDCNARTYLRALPAALPGVAGVLIDEQQDLLFSSDRGAARVSVFRCSDEQLLAQVEVGPHPNGLAYDRTRRQLYSFNLGDPVGENCTASVIGLDSMGVIAELPLPGRPRWALYDPERDVIYANIQQGAHTTCWDPISQCLYVFCPASGGAAVYEERA